MIQEVKTADRGIAFNTQSYVPVYMSNNVDYKQIHMLFIPHPSHACKSLIISPRLECKSLCVLIYILSKYWLSLRCKPLCVPYWVLFFTKYQLSLRCKPLCVPYWVLFFTEYHPLTMSYPKSEMAGGGPPPPGAPVQAQPAAAGQGTSLCSCNNVNVNLSIFISLS